MRCVGPAVIVCLLGLAMVAPSLAGQRKPSRASSATTVANPFDRVAYAVDGAESSHGANQAMWRADPSGPQGPMQVSAAAASDVGGGDRFDPDQNREIGRAYLAQLYNRYGDWPDAVAAYNWGIGNLEAWVKAGRPADGLEFGVAAYLGRVLHDSEKQRGCRRAAKTSAAGVGSSPADELSRGSALCSFTISSTRRCASRWSVRIRNKRRLQRCAGGPTTQHKGQPQRQVPHQQNQRDI
jgi:Transglycosylase SLT domain